jgi:hypothetical protein
MLGKSKKKHAASKLKTKKRRRSLSITKYRGGASADTPKASTVLVTNPATTNPATTSPNKSSTLKTPEEIMQQIKDDRKIQLIPTEPPKETSTEEEGVLSEATNLTTNIATEVSDDSVHLAEGLTLNAIEKTSDLIGVDLANSEATRAKLDDIKETLSDPKTQEKVNEVVGQAAQVGALAVEASKPFLDPLIDTANEKGEEVLTKLGQTGVKVLLNTATEIPGVGVVIGSLRSISNVGEAIVATANAGSEVAIASADTINASSKNFDQLLAEKQHIETRTKSSIEKHEDPLKHAVPAKSVVPKGGGGTKRYKHNKKYGGKSKRVRFRL